MILDNSMPEKEREEIVRQIIKEKKLLKSLPNPHKLPLWELDKNFKISRVEYKTVTIDAKNWAEGKPEISRLRADVKEGAIYILALHEESANRKFLKMLTEYRKKLQTLKTQKDEKP